MIKISGNRSVNSKLRPEMESTTKTTQKRKQEKNKKMSTIELETQLKKIENQIVNRKNAANELKLPGKISEVAKNYGKIADFNGSHHFFTEKGLSISFESSLQRNDVGEIHLYIPGDWEKRIEELYLEIPERQRKKEISLLLNEIDLLKKKWEIGD